MGRLQREFLVSSGSGISITAGSSDGQTKLDLIAPFAGARVDRFTLTQKTAGTGTGSFTVVLEEADGTDLSAALTVDPDAAADTVLGTALGNGTKVSATGVHLAVATVKTGAVTGSPVMLLNVLWQM